MPYYTVPRMYAELPFKLVRKDASAHNVNLVIECANDPTKRAMLSPKTSIEWDRIEVVDNHSSCGIGADVPINGDMVVRAAVRLVPENYATSGATVGSFLVHWNRDGHRPFVSWRGSPGVRTYLRDASLTAQFLAKPVHSVHPRYAKDQPIEIDGGEIGVILDGIGPFDRPDLLSLILTFILGVLVGGLAVWISTS